MLTITIPVEPEDKEVMLEIDMAEVLKASQGGAATAKIVTHRHGAPPLTGKASITVRKAA